MEQELAFKLQEDGIFYQTHVEIPVTTADFYFPTEGEPIVVFADGKIHLGSPQILNDEELRSLLRKRGYKILEPVSTNHSSRMRDGLCDETLGGLGKGSSTNLAAG